MISDVSSKVNTATNTQSAANTANQSLNDTGVLAKLSSEIKLIGHLKTATLLGSESLNFQGKPAQLLHASSAQRPFSLINTGTPIDVNNPKTSQFNNMTVASRVLNLTVTAVGGTSSNGTQTATVSDGDNSFSILSQTTLKKGDNIRVLIDSSNNLQVLPSKLSANATSTQLDAIKHSLPRQLSLMDMSQLIKQLQSLNNNPAGLPEQTQAALKQLTQHLPNLAALTASPEAMKNAIQNSGLFSESLLAQDTKTQLPADLKLNLIRLKDAQESMSTIKLGGVQTEQIANAVERITTNQLRHFTDLSPASLPTYPLQIELPIKDGQNSHFVQLEIDQDASTQDHEKQDRRWLVKLKFDFEETGRFDARASIQNNTVGVLFAAENPDTVQALQKNIPSLKERLEEKDISINRLDAFQTALPNQETKPTKTSSLIDVRT
ncbi:flagellar hook-length control protein FliK [Marinomonas sp. IMCC 4694]|uniref:flagellar hook-length control protein FliK n=1 Tax=Marinomonas sp. IMCC 4694 TaxID=2605432 RepID=UPI00165328FC|nr:flagellar hook-length control protein FliK [Marinomonas sp. IMCC 4694]